MEYIEYDYEGHPHRFSFNYLALKEDYNRFKAYSDEEFLENLPEILHFTVFICRLKEIPSYNCLGDLGIVHELVHLLNKIESPFISLDKVRLMWDDIMKL